MKSLPVIFFTGAVWLALSAIAHGAQGTEEPARRRAGDYQLIVERNPFGLKPAMATVTLRTPVVTPSATVRLVGIARVSGQLKAYLVVTPVGKAVGEYINLRPGEAAEGLEMVQVDAQSGTVTVRQNDETKVLKFQDGDHIKPAMAIQQPVPRT